MMEDLSVIAFDTATHEVLSRAEYEDNQKRKKAGDTTARDVRLIDSRRVIIEKGKIVGSQSVAKSVEKAPEVSAPEVSAPEEDKEKNHTYPTSISDFIEVEAKDEVQVQKPEESPQYDVDDPDLFINLLYGDSKEKKKAKALESTPIVPTGFSFTSYNLNDPDLFIKITERRQRLKKLQAEVDALDPYKLFKQVLVEEQTQKIIGPSVIEPQMEQSPIQDDYRAALEQSVSIDARPIERKHTFKYVPSKKVIAIVLAAGLAFGGLGMARSAVIDSGWYQGIQENIEMASTIKEMEKHDAKFNDVTPNKITLPNQFDSYGSPMYWLDTDGVAMDILNEGDKNFAAALYYAYYEMEGIRNVGEYHNWDSVISSISRSADEKEHPTAYGMTEGCYSFEGFLIKNGLVNEDGTPSPEMFEKYGKEALKAYSESLAMENDAPSYGGRA